MRTLLEQYRSIRIIFVFCVVMPDRSFTWPVLFILDYKDAVLLLWSGWLLYVLLRGAVRSMPNPSPAA